MTSCSADWASSELDDALDDKPTLGTFCSSEIWHLSLWRQKPGTKRPRRPTRLTGALGIALYRLVLFAHSRYRVGRYG